MRNLETQLKSIEDLLRKKERLLEYNHSLKQLNFLVSQIFKELREIPPFQRKQFPLEIKEILSNYENNNNNLLEVFTMVLIDILKWKYKNDL